MTLGATPSPAQILAELGQAFPYTFPDARTRWLADVGIADPIVFPTSFASKTSVKVVYSVADAGGGSPHTFTGVDFGPAFSDRILVACTCLRETGAAPLAISAVTIGGVSAVGDDNGEAFTPGIGTGIFAAAVPTGISGNVVVTWSSATANAAGLILLSVAKISTTAHDSGSQAVDSGGADNASCALDIPSNGLLIASCAHTNTNNETFVGVTERASVVVGAGRLAVGFDNRMNSESNRAVSCSWTTSAARGLHARSYAQV